MGVSNKQLFRSFKLQGLSLHKDAFQRIERELQIDPYLQADDVIYAIKNNIDRSKLPNGVVTLEVMKSALDSLLKVSSENNFQALQVFDAFELPKIQYIPSKNAYELLVQDNRRMHASAQTKINMIMNRYTIIEQRVSRNKVFRPPDLALAENSSYVTLSNIASILGTTGSKKILGLLGQDERGKLYLEDRTGRLAIDTSKSDVQFQTGLFTIGSFVLAEGEVMEDTLIVDCMAMPPPETRKDSLFAIGGIDPLGVEMSPQQLLEVRAVEAQDNSSSFVMLSDVHLDDPIVMEKLADLFAGFAPFPPTSFVFMGNFTSRPVGQGSESYGISDLKDYFDALGILMGQFPELTNTSRFIFIPGPADPGLTDVIPKKCLPKICTQGLSQKFKNVTMASNPCRIRYYTQDIIIFREDLVQKLRRHSINPISNENYETRPVDEQLVKTVIDQGHLCPLPLSIQPVYWDYDNALQLFPAPDVLVLADEGDYYKQAYQGTTAFNPSPFHIDYTFVVYQPSDQQAIKSRIE